MTSGGNYMNLLGFEICLGHFGGGAIIFVQRLFASCPRVPQRWPLTSSRAEPRDPNADSLGQCNLPLPSAMTRLERLMIDLFGSDPRQALMSGRPAGSVRFSAMAVLKRVPEEGPVNLSAQWQAVLAKHGLERPSSQVLIHVYRVRVVLINEHCVGQSVTPADPDSDPSMVVQHPFKQARSSPHNKKHRQFDSEKSVKCNVLHKSQPKCSMGLEYSPTWNP